MPFVYILRCSDKSLYVEMSDNVDARVVRHNEGRGSAYTAARRPVSVAYSENHPTATAARQRECQIKRWTAAKKEALVAGDLALLKRL